eukprot:6199112-Pleurochrysis_carterae.AAC.3
MIANKGVVTTRLEPSFGDALVQNSNCVYCNAQQCRTLSSHVSGSLRTNFKAGRSEASLWRSLLVSSIADVKYRLGDGLRCLMKGVHRLHAHARVAATVLEPHYSTRSACVCPVLCYTVRDARDVARVRAVTTGCG